VHGSLETNTLAHGGGSLPYVSTRVASTGIDITMGYLAVMRRYLVSLDTANTLFHHTPSLQLTPRITRSGDDTNTKLLL
jgi:hypothetical protein